MKNRVESDIAHPGDLSYLLEVVPIAFAQRENRAPGTEHVLPEVRKGAGGRRNIDGNMLLFRGTLAESCERKQCGAEQNQTGEMPLDSHFVRAYQNQGPDATQENPGRAQFDRPRKESPASALPWTSGPSGPRKSNEISMGFSPRRAATSARASPSDTRSHSYYVLPSSARSDDAPARRRQSSSNRFAPDA